MSTDTDSAGVLRQQLNKFYGSRRCVSKIALELMRRPTAAQSAEPSRDRALMRNAGVEKSEKIYAIAQFMTPSITEKATGKVAF